ncbi:23S rRNA (adenine(2503)-C(2))-methyltransferase RlmN [Corallococcus sp. BB11-1]|uniref:23S rRNA (adenine(2503)-C(2))-methyltransferase RlmN n=1 Tax=Corallococcus sp. BB11-1 TaxID=2996783 RepID=UPI00226EDE41|nr:23S rRNA (adenine(2503)-C(2))-methyltransferase RlmN [Corallococcus sp. BB11-1]MCY1031704.1 23S rRNA (adenine(2503)-C(2))-methyltransferase RlmN [Corallococcus sp. BB11-1]
MSDAPTAPNLYDLPRPALDARLADWGFSPQYRERVWTGLYRDGVTALGDVAGLRPDLQAVLQERARLGHLTTHHESFSSDGLTHKLLLRLHDGQTIETVLMRFKGRATVCVSTQAGCAMGCVFCATGQMGLSRHLTPGEVVGQVLHVTRILREQGEALRNIVLMGMGEPLHNYDNTMAAMDILVDPKGLALAPRFITLSTVGVVPGIIRLADEARPVQLAVSLHGATDAERAALVPAGRRWPLQELMDACRYYVAKRRRRIFFEWTLIAGRNDTAEHAHHLGALLHGLDAHVNVIPLNPTVGYDGGPSVPDAVRAFQDVLTSHGVPSTVRQRRGIDIDAGCGQLKAAVERKPRRPLPVAS